MNRISTFFVAIFAVVCVLAFSGQYRYARPAQKTGSSVPKRTTAPVPVPHPVSQPEPVPEVVKEPALGPVKESAEMPLLVLRPDDMQWPHRDDPTAPISITLLGERTGNGLYVTRTYIPKGKKIIPHVHADSRTVVVLSGTYYYGLGDTFDESKLVALPRGTFLTEPAGIPHYNWAKDGDVVVQTTAVGPTGTRVIPDKKEDQQ